MADYALYRMRLRQENKLAAISSKQDPERALAYYEQAMDLNTRLVDELLLRQDSDKLSPSMQEFYWQRVFELANRSNR